MKSSHLLYAFVALLASVLFVYAFFIDKDNIVGKIAISFFCFILVFFATTVVIPPEERKQKTIRISIWALMVITMSVLSGPVWIPLLIDYLPFSDGFKTTVGNFDTRHALIVYVFFLIPILFLIHRLSNRSVLGHLEKPITEEFRDLNFPERYEIFINELKSDLQVLDRDLRWNISHFVPLDAEVEIVNEHKTTRKVSDLLQALKKINTARVNLVLGVPGAGKSVALRKMCSDLLNQTKANDRIPIYINLKEWYSDRPWTVDMPPTEREFRDFVYENVKGRLADQSKPFFEEYFERMANRGRIFFVLDSFDEIPGILDSDESSTLLVKISDLLVRFLKSGLDSKGIIASRYYRRPQINDADRSILEIRPFNELHISQAINNASPESAKLSKYLFDDRPDLAAASRNPFVLSLILKYVSNFNNLPERQADLFEHYISDSLSLADENLKATGISHDEIISAMREISWIMFESERYGLEMPVSKLRKKLPGINIDDVVSILEGVRLARISSINRSFSFVHRRFNEYFLVHKFIDDPDSAPLESIPSDSRWRDAMVLYTEVAGEDQAKEIANYCFNELNKLDSSDIFQDKTRYLRSLHSLRFLVEAFRGRVNTLIDLQDKLGKKVIELISDEEDLISSKHAVEAVGILKESDAQKVLIIAMEKDNSWISETAFKASRYLTKLTEEAENLLLKYIRNIPILDIFRRSKEFSFALNTADIFKKLSIEYSVIKLEKTINIIGALGLMIFFPKIFLSVAILVILIYIFKDYVTDYYQFLYKNLNKGILDVLLMLVRLIFSLFITTGILVYFIPPNDQSIVPPLEFSKYLNFPNLVVQIITFILALMILPWLKIFRVLKSMNKDDFDIFFEKEFYKEIFRLIIILSVVFFIVGSVIAILALIGSFLPKLLKIILASIFMLFMVIMLLSILVSIIRETYLNHMKLKKAKRVFSPQRTVIAEKLNELTTRTARYNYVRWLEVESSNYISSLEDSENAWPNNKRPNYDNDPASTLLARLDAKWLKLDV